MRNTSYGVFYIIFLHARNKLPQQMYGSNYFISAVSRGGGMYMKSLKLSDYFEIVDPKYIVLKLTPVKSLRNYNSDKIVAAVASLYRSLTQRIVRENRKLMIVRQVKVSYYIYMDKNKIEFYFVVPERYLPLLKSKISDTWASVTVKKVDTLPTVGDNPVKYYLTYKKEDALSLSTDRRNNVLLSGLLNTAEVLEQGERCAVMFSFCPTSQSSWRANCVNAIQKYADGLPMDRQKLGGSYILKNILIILIDVLGVVLESVSDIFGAKKPEPPKMIRQNLSPETLRKKDSTVVNTQIIVMSSSENKHRAINNAISVCQSFSALNSDNELVYRRYYNHPDTFKATPLECQNFVSLPGKELIEEHNINCIDVMESKVPKELQSGKICIGENTYHGHKQKAYLSTDKSLQYLSLVLIGPTRAGKTTLIRNITQDATDAGECTIIFDFCKSCELSDEISARINHTLSIDCSDPKNLQGMGYNEVTMPSDLFEAYVTAKTMANQLITLIDSIASSDSLTSRMNRYLESAAVVVFLNGGSFYRVIQCLSDAEVRAEEIEKISKLEFENIQKHIKNLQELNEGTCGTKYHLISGIMDRIDKLQQNAYMEMMFEKSCDDNINLIDEMGKSQVICIRIPDSMFPTLTDKDVYCTYWITKIWLALQLRKSDIKVNIVVDELYQVPHCQDFIRSKLSQMAKYHAKMIISAHYLEQIPIIRNELKAANSSYILISGADKDNYKELKDELQPYTVDDLLCLKRYHALCLIKIADGYARFTVKLPPK